MAVGFFTYFLDSSVGIFIKFLEVKRLYFQSLTELLFFHMIAFIIFMPSLCFVIEKNIWFLLKVK